MTYYKCRVCLKLEVLQNVKSVGYKSDHKPFDTIYDMLLFCVPQLLHSLSKSEFICIICIAKLTDCVKFLEQCIHSDDRIKNEHLENLEEDNKDYVTFDVENYRTTDSEDDVLFESGFYSEPKKEDESDVPEIVVYKELPTSNNESFQINLLCAETLPCDIEETNTKNTPSILRGLLVDKSNRKKGSTSENCDDYVEEEDITEIRKDRCTLETDVCDKASVKASNKQSKKLNHAQEQSKSRKAYMKHVVCDGCGKKVNANKRHVCKFTCMKCDNKFTSKNELEKHVIENMGEEECTVACSYCPLLVAAKEFEEHMRTHPTIMCELCSKCFSSVTSLKSHHLTHNEKTEKCPECDWSFKTKGALRAHVNCVHKKKEKSVLCDMCPKKFHTHSKFMIHKRRHHYQIKQGVCAKCGKTFTDKKAVEYHDRLVHLKIKPFSCDICGTTFGRKDYMQQHRKICNKARSRLSGQGRKKKYMRVKAAQPVECVYCHKILSSIHNLKLHIKLVHTKAPRKFKCEVCGLQFAAKANLKKHEIIHKDPECKYRCNVCFKKYKSADELQEHVAQKHKKKPHKCEVCGEKFARRFIMENHKYDAHPSAPDLTTCEEKTKEIMDEAIRHLMELGEVDEIEEKFPFCADSEMT